MFRLWILRFWNKIFDGDRMNFDKTFGLENKERGKIFVGIQKKYHVFYAMIDTRIVEGKLAYELNHDWRCASKTFYNKISQELINTQEFKAMVTVPPQIFEGLRIESTYSDTALIGKTGEGLLA